MVVGHVIPRSVDIVLEDAGDMTADTVPPLALLAFLERCVGLGPMDELQTGRLTFELTVAEIDPSDTSRTRARVPEQQ